MPTISTFDGILISMMYGEGSRHNQPHLHAFYGGQEVLVSLDGEVLAGSIPKNKMKLLLLWMELHTDELQKNWQLMIEHKPLNKIKPLKITEEI